MQQLALSKTDDIRTGTDNQQHWATYCELFAASPLPKSARTLLAKTACCTGPLNKSAQYPLNTRTQIEPSNRKTMATLSAQGGHFANMSDNFTCLLFLGGSGCSDFSGVAVVANSRSRGACLTGVWAAGASASVFTSACPATGASAPFSDDCFLLRHSAAASANLSRELSPVMALDMNSRYACCLADGCFATAATTRAALRDSASCASCTSFRARNSLSLAGFLGGRRPWKVPCEYLQARALRLARLSPASDFDSSPDSSANARLPFPWPALSARGC